MTSQLQQIQQEIQSLSEEEQKLLMDFIEILKKSHKLSSHNATSEVKQNKYFLENTSGNLVTNQENDPLIGLFSGSPNLAEQSEDILQREIKQNSGWTWKS